MNITILTPTYNRGYIINNLYESLLQQTSKNFEWLIIDDGSSDNTKEIVRKMIGENKIKISYFYQKNGGKHRALNNGISRIKTELTFIVDSDDYLTKDAIQTIEEYSKKYEKNDNIASFSFLRANNKMEINGPKYPSDEFVSDYISFRINKHNSGDKAEVYRTNCLKEFPFLEIDGENFLVESYVWAQMALKYDTVYINKIIYISEYLNDGLTKNVLRKSYESPIGMVEKSKVLCNKKANLIAKSKAIIKYIAYSNVAKFEFKKQFKEIRYKLLFFCLYPVGKIYYLYLRKLQTNNPGK